MGHADGCRISAFCSGDSEGECRWEAGFEVARDGVLDDNVWLSRVSCKDVMTTCGT